MIRVAHVFNEMNGDRAERTVMNYYAAIDREKIQFDFFMCKGSKKVPTEEIKALGGRIFVLPAMKKASKYKATLHKLLSENNYSILHCHSSVRASVVLSAAKKAGVQIRIMHYHSASRRIFRASANALATHRFADCDFTARKMYGALPVCRLNEGTLPIKHATTIPYAVDLQQHAYSAKKRSEVRGEFKIPSKTLVFGYIGEPTIRPDSHFIVDIFRRIVEKHKNSALILTGTGKDKDLIQARAINAGLNGKIIFADERADTDRLCSAFDCMLMPIKQGEFPTSAVEAQCSGLYCLFSDKVICEASLTDSAQFLSLKNSADDWACAALCCAKLRNSKAVEQLSASEYNIKQAAEDLEKFYLSL